MISPYGTLTKPSEKSSYDGVILASQLGLKSEVCSHERYYLADEIHKLLVQGMPVYNAHSARGEEYSNSYGLTWFPNQTHTATKCGLVIGIRDIKEDRSETPLEVDLLRRARLALMGYGKSPVLAMINEYLEHLDKEVKDEAP